MNKKNKALAAALAALIVIVIAVFIIFLRPLLAEEPDDETPLETQEGESIGTLGKYQIHKKLERADMQRIYIHNSTGEYAFVRGSDGEFVIEGLEDLPYSTKYFSALVSVVGNPLALVKVSSNDSGYEEYGISDSDTWWEVTDTAGNVYRMTVGHMTHTAGGYYVSYSGRNAVYVLGGDISQALGSDETGTSLDLTVLKPIEYYVSPVLIAGISSDEYYLADKFTIFKDGDMFVSMKIVDKEDQVNPDAILENIVTYPAAYQPDSDYLYEVLQKVTALNGTYTEKAGATEEDYADFGLDDPKYMIAYYYDDQLYTILASETLEDGSYYATSSMNPTVIARVSADSLGFLEEDLLSWISPYPFNYSITSIEKFSVSGKNADYDFYLRHGTDDKGNATLTVDAENHVTGENRTIADEDEVWNFRSFYRTILYSQIEDSVPLTDEQIDELTADENNCILTFEYTLTSGTKRTLKFWQYSTRRTLLTINGEGEYYVYLDRAEKILSDAAKAYAGEEVDSHAKN